MWKKYLVPLVGFVIGLVGIVYYVLQFAVEQPQNPPPAPALEQASELQGGPGGAPAAPETPVDAEVPADAQAAPALPPESKQAPSPGAIPGGPASVPALVTYDGKSFAPATVEIQKGGGVTFANQGTGEMWPASAMHPTHAVYPTTGGCIGSTFDACRGIAPGDIWSFTFDQAGSWKYHDHLNPSVRGTINVK